MAKASGTEVTCAQTYAIEVVGRRRLRPQELVGRLLVRIGFWLIGVRVRVVVSTDCSVG